MIHFFLMYFKACSFLIVAEYASRKRKRKRVDIDVHTYRRRGEQRVEKLSEDPCTILVYKSMFNL